MGKKEVKEDNAEFRAGGPFKRNVMFVDTCNSRGRIAYTE